MFTSLELEQLLKLIPVEDLPQLFHKYALHTSQEHLQMLRPCQLLERKPAFK
jgi:hypothetical protein